MEDKIRDIFATARETIRQSGEDLTGKTRQAVDMIVECYKSGGGVLTFGNGGSAADAQHIACELVGRFMKVRPPLKAEAISTNTSSLTAIANDYDYETIFARQVEAQGSPGDVAIALSTSGNSANVIAALEKARQIGMKTIAFTGRGGGQCAALADVLLDAPADTSPRIQEAHAVIYHIICELVEAEMFPDE